MIYLIKTSIAAAILFLCLVIGYHFIFHNILHVLFALSQHLGLVGILALVG